jgi:hypothetical protein
MLSSNERRRAQRSLSLRCTLLLRFLITPRPFFFSLVSSNHLRMCVDISFRSFVQFFLVDTYGFRGKFLDELVHECEFRAALVPGGELKSIAAIDGFR